MDTGDSSSRRYLKNSLCEKLNENTALLNPCNIRMDA